MIPAARRMSVGDGARLVAHETRFDMLMFVRNRQATFFTMALPIIFLVIFASVFRNDTTKLRDGTVIDQSAYYVPQIIALGIVSAAFNFVVASVIAQRETGVLKRRRATPVPAGVIVMGRAATAIAISFALTAILLVVGRIVYGVHAPARTAPALFVTVLAGSLSLCAIAYAMTTIVESQDSAQPVIQAITLPIFFISGIFFPEAIVPDWMINIANIFPVRHLAQALLSAFNPETTGAGFSLPDLANMAVWGGVALAVAIRRFGWMPRAIKT